MPSTSSKREKIVIFGDLYPETAENDDFLFATLLVQSSQSPRASLNSLKINNGHPSPRTNTNSGPLELGPDEAAIDIVCQMKSQRAQKN